MPTSITAFARKPSAWVCRGLFVLGVAWASAVSAQTQQAIALTALGQFIAQTKSAQADFVQITEMPSRKSGAPPAASAPGRAAVALRGRFEFRRPNQFKFHYLKPFEQVIQSDGQTLWIHDVDLNQVTQRKFSVAAAFAPALLVAAAADVAALTRLYDLQALPEDAGLLWVRATPRPRNTAGESPGDPSAGGLGGVVRHVDVGFRAPAGAPTVLAQIIITDAAGQRTLMSFDNLRANPAFVPSHFSFKPPVGAAVMSP